MAADSDGTECYSITTVVTCEGDLTDPKFPFQLEWIITNLQDLLGGKLFIRKLEPWNSVRVTLSIPREAAARLRHLAAEGAQQLRALGILSIQVEGDQVISLRLAGPEPQEIILRTTQDGNSSSSTSGEAILAQIVGDTQLSNNAAPAPPEKIQFRSPNVLCPTDTVVPKVPSQNVASTSAVTNTRSYTGPFPFTSMNQAIHSRENATLGTNNYNASPSQPQQPSLLPPPYPGKNPPITISSPLLVNLLQNDGVNVKANKTETETTTLTSTAVSPAVVSSPSVYKYSAVSLCAQDNALYRKAVTTKTNAVLPTVISQTIVQHLTTELNNSHSNSVLPLSSVVNQCNSKKPTSISTPSNHVLSNPTNPITTLAMTPNSIQQTAYAALPTAVHNPVANFISKPAGTNSQVQPPTHAFTNTTLPFTITTSAISISSATRQASAKPSETLSIPNSIKSNLLSSSSNIYPLDSSQSTRRNTITFSPAVSPPLPVYSSCQFDQPLLELTPSLTELKATDLEQILPSLESDLVRSPPSIPEELINSSGSDRCNYLINPLTGELEPHVNSDIDEETPADIFTGLPTSPNITSDEDSNSTCRPDTTDQSDSESRSNHSDSSKNSRFKGARNREKGRDSPNLKPTEKIKLRLKLEKSEPIINPAYKVDVSYISVAANKKPSNAVVATSEELRVPPLHISLKGRNHVVINNRKKIKNSLQGNTSKLKVHKTQDSWKFKKSSTEGVDQSNAGDNSGSSVGTISASSDQRRVKKIKTQDHREQNLDGHILENDVTKYPFGLYPKERRGSDSDLTHSVKRYEDVNGIFPGDKKRRLSHTEQIDVESQPHLFVLGSTNTGTVTALPLQKPRKEKIKLKDCPKVKELNRNKNFAKNLTDKLLLKQLILPTGEIDMEAKFKQRLLEDGEKGIPRPPHRTEIIQNIGIANSPKEIEHVNTLTDPPTVKDKPPEGKNVTESKNDMGEKHGRSPNSGGQGEDSGIESMDALSEKSPNQASQSPHTDISDSLKSKPQVPTILDIEAQLAEMEGLNGEDMNENKHNGNTSLEQCCSLTSALQDSLKQGTVSLTTLPSPVIKEQLPQVEVSLVALNPALISDKDLEPTPVHISPPLYTYSNPDKHRDSDSPSLSDYDINSCSLLIKNNNLLEQLLIHIPDNQNPSSPSHMTRSLRSRTSSKLSSPDELNSPVLNKSRVPPAKRKRRESDSSVNSLEDVRNRKPRTSVETLSIDTSKLVKKTKMLEDSSDSDEPLIEVAGKVRKNNINSSRTKFKAGIFSPGAQKLAVPVKTRSSVRTMPALNTRSKGDTLQAANAVRRKTRSAVSEGEGKRRKAEVK